MQLVSSKRSSSGSTLRLDAHKQRGRRESWMWEGLGSEPTGRLKWRDAGFRDGGRLGIGRRAADQAGE